MGLLLEYICIYIYNTGIICAFRSSARASTAQRPCLRPSYSGAFFLIGFEGRVARDLLKSLLVFDVCFPSLRVI